jgi:hypothetical protein
VNAAPLGAGGEIAAAPVAWVFAWRDFAAGIAFGVSTL